MALDGVHKQKRTELTAVPVAVPPVAVESGGGGDLHLQLLALGGVSRHGVAVVRPEAALALGPHRLGQLIGGVGAGAPASQSAVLFGGARTRVSIPAVRLTSPWQQDERGRSSRRRRWGGGGDARLVCVSVRGVA